MCAFVVDDDNNNDNADDNADDNAGVGGFGAAAMMHGGRRWRQRRVALINLTPNSQEYQRRMLLDPKLKKKRTKTRTVKLSYTPN